ncbi:hypothetical protein [Aquiflexum gelatinilyticum]|nr:hypothetical protein [Aquiflexum gelatinilyticum]MCS4435198.1 hypothetical protein [Aquiflexum gelatinilyticum]
MNSELIFLLLPGSHTNEKFDGSVTLIHRGGEESQKVKRCFTSASSGSA